MTEKFIRLVKEEYKDWAITQEKHINEKNHEIELKIIEWERIHSLLQDEKVKEFAKAINYIEKISPPKLLTLENSLYDFIKRYMSSIEWSKKELEQDKYPIYCFLKSQEPIYSARTGAKICGFKDLYWNLQQPGYSFGPSDSTINGKNREAFKKKNIENIIYAPEGESFGNKEAFYKVQTEFVEETLKTNQGEAKKLILAKYGRNNNTK